MWQKERGLGATQSGGSNHFQAEAGQEPQHFRFWCPGCKFCDVLNVHDTAAFGNKRLGMAGDGLSRVQPVHRPRGEPAAHIRQERIMSTPQDHHICSGTQPVNKAIFDFLPYRRFINLADFRDTPGINGTHSG